MTHNGSVFLERETEAKPISKILLCARQTQGSPEKPQVSIDLIPIIVTMLIYCQIRSKAIRLELMDPCAL
jgi:hypothetical protein